MIEEDRIEQQHDCILTEQKYGQQQQLYDYLLMTFVIKQSQKYPLKANQQCPQLNYLQNQSIDDSNILSLFVDKTVDKEKGFLDFYSNKTQNQQQKLWIFLQKIIQRYPSLFFPIINSSITWEQIIGNVIKIGSMKQIFSHLMILNANKFNMQKDSSLQMKQFINFFFASIFFDKEFREVKKQKGQIIKSLKQKINAQLNNFYHKVTSVSIDQKNCIINQIRNILFQELQKTFSIGNQEEQLGWNFHKQYHTFLQLFKVQQIPVNLKIFQLHYVQKLLQNTQSSSLQSFISSYDNLLYGQNKYSSKLKNINFFNLQNTQNKQKIVLNQALLKSFIKAPYQTSLFILYTLLSCSDYKEIKRFFDNTKSMKFIDPMLYLLVKTQLINNLNIEAVSLSIWIMTQVWLKYVEGKAKERINLSSYNIVQAQKSSKLRDPRKIFTINQDAYSAVQTSTNGTTQKASISSIEQFENNYKRPLMHTIAMFLLTLNVESTMLKYYCIENDLLKEMSQGDILPTLLVKNHYIFNSTKSLARTSKSSKDFQLQLQQKIINAKTVQELEQLERFYQQSQTKKFSVIQHEEQLNFFQKQIQQPLPWLQIIESKQFLLPLLNKPAGYGLILKIIEKNPHLYLKLYETHLFKMICTEIERKNHQPTAQNKEKQANNQPYKFQGNKNVKLKKNISYNSQPLKQSSTKISKTQNKFEKQQKFQAIKQILDLFKSHANDDNIKNSCNQLLKYL